MPLFKGKTGVKTLPKNLGNDKNLKSALKHDAESAAKHENSVKWFHRNTNRNLAEHRLKG